MIVQPLAFLIFFIAAAVTVWAAICLVLFRKSLNRLLRVTYIAGTFATAITTYLTTYHYGYFSDENTYFIGWPVPVAVFQRDSPTSPWLDFVGPTVVLGYLMNLLLFLLIPSVLVFIHLIIQRRPKNG